MPPLKRVLDLSINKSCSFEVYFPFLQNVILNQPAVKVSDQLLRLRDLTSKKKKENNGSSGRLKKEKGWGKRKKRKRKKRGKKEKGEGKQRQGEEKLSGFASWEKIPSYAAAKKSCFYTQKASAFGGWETVLQTPTGVLPLDYTGRLLSPRPTHFTPPT